MWLATGVSLAALITVVAGGRSAPALGPTPPAPTSSPVPADAAEARENARRIAALAAPAWEKDGLDPELAAQLRKDVETVITSILAEDFYSYDAWMRARGGTADAKMAAIVQSLRSGGFRTDTDPCWNGTDPVAQMARVWRSPRNCRAEWAALHVDQTRAGYGLRSTHTNPSGAGEIALPSYEFPRYLEIVGDAQLDLHPIAWVTLVGDFKIVPELMFPDQVETLRARGRDVNGPMHIQLAFAYDDEARTWVPVWTIVIGEFGRPHFRM